jgi:outer membrane protein assembly factor BamD (BamD/ComL family)
MRNKIFLKIITVIVILFITSCAATKKYEQAKIANSITAYENYLDKYEKSKYGPIARQELAILYEDRDWKDAKYNNSISGYKAFISKYPNSDKSILAKNKIAEIEEQQIWKKAKNINKVFGYENFLSIYPNSKYAFEAKNRIEKLRDEMAWSETVRIGTIDSYKKYTSNLPDGDHYSEAIEKIDELEVVLPEWNKVLEENTVAAYRLFIEKFYYPSYTSKAKKKIKELENKEWVIAKEQNNVEYYEKYLADFPNGKYTEEAEKRIIDIEVEAIFKGDHGKLPPMNKGGSGSGSYQTISEIQVYNNTKYTLTLRYSGPESKKVIFHPKQKKTITLKKGAYRVAASVNISSVRNYAGTEEVKGGMIYESQYYIRTEQY